MTRDKLTETLESHKLWLSGKGGKRADLRLANLLDADLRVANLRWATLRGANLRCANLRGADLRSTNLIGATLISAILIEADLRDANMIDANLTGADLRGANLSGANLRRANLNGANLSGAKGLLQTSDFMAFNFERTPDGYIAYKTFNGQYKAPDAWEIKPGSIIEETVNFDRCTECGSGINVAPLEWVWTHRKGEIWKVLIRWEWMCGVCIPYNTDRKIRCERVELLGVVSEAER